MHVFGDPEGVEGEIREKVIFEEIITKNFRNTCKTSVPNEDVLKTLHKIDTK